MSAVEPFQIVDSLVLGTKQNENVPIADQDRQRAETVELLKRLHSQPGVVLADEVGMGKTSLPWQSAIALDFRVNAGLSL